VSGVNRTHYCGAYWFYGFHEDGLKLGVARRAPAGGRVSERWSASDGQ